jgi:hypothetical protein
MTLSTTQIIRGKKTTITRLNNKLGRDVEGSLWEGPVLSSCDHNNKFSGSIKGREHLEQLNGYQIEAVMV